MLSCAPQGFDRATFSPPPVDGSLSIPELFDYNGVHSPDHPAFVYSDKSSLRTITWSHASHAVNRAASFIRQQVEQNGPHNDRATIIAILANLDTFTSSTMIMGIIRAGYQAFPISTRHSPDSIAQLLLRTRSKFLIVGRDLASMELATSACALPSIGGVVGDFVTKLTPISWDDIHVHADTSFSRVPPHHPRPTDLALILHSSGTTSSSPKIVRITHLALLQWGMHPYYGDTDLSKHTLSAHSHPLNSAVGVIPVLWSACTGLTLAVFPPSVWSPEPNPDDVLHAAVETGCSVLLCVPSLLEVTHFGKKLSAGAVLRKQPGDFLWNSGVRLQNVYGATEFGVVSNFFTSNIRDDGLNAWDYFKFSSNCIPQMVPQGGNVYHLFLMDCPTLSLNVINVECRGSYYYDTHDLLMQHPTDPTLWRLYGRTDDIIQHSNGYKDIISRRHSIKACLMFGRGRRFSGLLVEPHQPFDTQDSTLLSGFIEDVWFAIVEEANRASANHSKICKDMIMVTNSSKPFRLTPKRTVDRDTVLQEYEDDIDALYRAVDPTSPMDSPTESPPRSGLEASDSIKLARMAVEKYISEPLSDDEDLFQAGCDSLQATWIRNVICNVLHYNLKLSTRNIPYNVVYVNPTIRKLGVYVAQVVRYGQAAVALCTGSSRIGEMEAMVRKYGSDFSRHRHRGVVLLTGSTGSLGSHLLELLVKDPAVACVYALNRRDAKGYRSVYIRQAAAFKDRDLDYWILNCEKVQLLEGNLADECFGLEAHVFEELRREVTCIIHNSWSLNFGTTLASLEPLIAGTRRLIDFALSSDQAVPPKLVFVSTLTFLNWPSGTTVPEGPNERPSTALGTGYTESKWIAESILVRAAEQTNLKVSIIRVGQLSGGPNGSWNPKEWLPSLIRSAQVVQCMPSPAGILAWMPVHLAAAAILEMRHSPRAFMNLAHPDPVPAVSVFQALADALRVPLVDYAEWLVALEASMRAGAGRSLTCMSLLDFYRTAYRPPGHGSAEAFGMARADTARAREAAPVMHRSIARLGPEDVDSWVRYWRRIGLLTR
ncbi:acetyl-CoA synthetase-like protein [Hymenopellis radicata]|nr:acetyl-CoA synthetase-like protein [Hymenopellis radicata]